MKKDLFVFKKNILIVLIVSVIIAFAFGATMPFIQNILFSNDNPNVLFMSEMNSMDINEKTSAFIYLKSNIQEEMRSGVIGVWGEGIVEGTTYRCCLQKACTYCIEKSPKHGEGASCDCLADILNGVHPCGECIGEILEGNGNQMIAKYFATSIAEEVGKNHLNELQIIIQEKYGVLIEEQI